MGPSSELAQSAAAMVSMVLVVLCILLYCLWDACAACCKHRRRMLRGGADSDSDSDSDSVVVALFADGPQLIARTELSRVRLAEAAKRRPPPPPEYSPPVRGSPPPPYEVVTGGRGVGGAEGDCRTGSGVIPRQSSPVEVAECPQLEAPPPVYTAAVEQGSSVGSECHQTLPSEVADTELREPETAGSIEMDLEQRRSASDETKSKSIEDGR
ncbi:hypothetical protein FJT64_024371 [Amphibalanus amphitrite]|uniref:Uncharacterized protein n=1 Tax=Amphibalanus amphitrite TaxID=1232801 RepID=A0A6A4WIU5_AMPAM|nr:hypothetical protein FJT64_024371 [Amphibalanus amphitrite]